MDTLTEAASAHTPDITDGQLIATYSLPFHGDRELIAYRMDDATWALMDNGHGPSHVIEVLIETPEEITAIATDYVAQSHRLLAPAATTSLLGPLLNQT